VADLGSGTGILGIGALLLGADKVFFVELDFAAIDVLRENLEKHIFDKKRYVIVHTDVKAFSEKVDLVIQNPPFGTKRIHADKGFLEKAFDIGQKVYSFHKLSTSIFVEAMARDHHFEIEGVLRFSYPLKKTQKFHFKPVVVINTGCWIMSLSQRAYDIKSEIRKSILKKRKMMPKEETLERSNIISENLRELPCYKRARRVLCYVATKNEVETRELIQKMLDEGKTVLVPRCDDCGMVACMITSLDMLSPGKYDIPEPAGTDVYDGSIDLAIIPLVAFDGFLNRIGQGGGDFDRFLHAHEVDSIVGLAYYFQKVQKVPSEAHDVRMNCVITDLGVAKLY